MPGLEPAQPIACDATAGSALDAVAANRTIESEEDGTVQPCRKSSQITAPDSGQRGRAGRVSQGRTRRGERRTRRRRHRLIYVYGQIRQAQS
jgi:hypothetical protein